MDYKYDVFFSYRHKPLDSQLTQTVFNMLESYRLPESLRKQGYTDIQRAFRDTEELPVSRILTNTIDEALRSTNCLVVVCSTDTPSSEWVDREVMEFIELDRADKIYPLLITGDMDSSFPPTLKSVPGIMDRVMDLRNESNDIRQMVKKAETEILKVIAGVTGCPENELRREHTLRKNRRFTTRVGITAAVLVLIAAVSLTLMNMARNYREVSRQREEVSMNILRELTYDLPNHLTNVPGAYSRIAGILKRNTEEINEILKLSTDRNKAIYEIASNYEKLANAGSVLGNYEDSLSAEEMAVGYIKILVEEKYPDSAQILASAYNNRGNIHHAAGKYTEAAGDYDRAISAMEDIQDADLSILARMAGNAAANAVSNGDTKAEEYFRYALELLKETPDENTRKTKAQLLDNYGVYLYRGGRYKDAEEQLRQACTEYESLRETNDSLQVLADHLRAMSSLASCLMDSGNFEEAERTFLQATETAEKLAEDEENLTYALICGELYNNYGLCLNIQGQYEQADPLYQKAAESYRKVYEKTKSSSDAALYATALLNTGENAFKSGDYKKSEEYFQSGLSIYTSVYDQLGVYDQSQYQAWRSYDLLIHKRNPEEAMQAALQACELQPNSVLANLNLAYAYLYAGYREECDRLFGILAGLGEGQRETIRRDLEAQMKAGLSPDHIPEVLEMIRN
ncbi:MAG: tetratricopeptide repeat protein [Solobacterium sp.]|nr:tetratricopeptide repeat protein [Solobacterium sp.]